MWILSSSSSDCSSEHSLSFKLVRIPMGDDRKEKRVRVEERSAVCNIGNERSSSDEVNGRTEEVRCPVCSRNFRSKKAMHGHMRCHPAVRRWRWRGVEQNPSPLPFPQKTASSNDDDHASLPSNSSITSTVVSSDDASLPLKKRRYRYELSDQAEGLALATSKQAKQAMQKSHQCRICGKTFPTGQALGGHQTCHRQQKPPDQADERAGPRVLDFDLNDLPPMDEE